jgi:hypothetical protein
MLNKKLAALAVALLAVLGLSLVAVPSPAVASAGAYTSLYHINQGGQSPIVVDCHNGRTVGVQWLQLSEGACGSDQYHGWVNNINANGCQVVKVRNWNTGNVTTYPAGYHGSVGGGYYDMWYNNAC